MKDSMKPCQHVLSGDLLYKEVVVIGNGPSGMVTSFMLAGNVPYLVQPPEDLPIDEMLRARYVPSIRNLSSLQPTCSTVALTSFMLAGNVPCLVQPPEDLPIDEMLRARLSNLPPGQSLYEVDLSELAEGLEGRSQNPIPLLMDNLLRPCTDLGIQADSLIEWKFDNDKQISHIVLGRGPPGGAWHTFPPTVRTLSPAGWLTLPPHPAKGAHRLTARAVANYCRRYVQACDLQRFFLSGVVVTSVRLLPRPPAPPPPCQRACPRHARFLVSGYSLSSGSTFSLACRSVVLCSGATDRPNRLEPSLASLAVHSLSEVERAVRAVADRAPGGDTVGGMLVVGSGVSAADAVRLALARGVSVAHVHRAPNDALARLSPTQYPDYCQVYKMMCDGPSGGHQNYTPYPEHIILEVIPQDSNEDASDEDNILHPKRVKLLDLVTNEIKEITVALIAILIGSKPDLFFLQTNFNLNCFDFKCQKCEPKHAAKRKIEDNERQCFLKNHWHYLKSVLGQSLQSCKSRYLNYTEINGNNTKCALTDCNKKDKCVCLVKIENGTIKSSVEKENYRCEEAIEDKCTCKTNPYASGMGFGIDPNKPVDGRANPIAIDKRTHELLNAPKGIYALGPLTADNFVRFIPGGALATVAHIQKEYKLTQH